MQSTRGYCGSSACPLNGGVDQRNDRTSHFGPMLCKFGPVLNFVLICVSKITLELYYSGPR